MRSTLPTRLAAVLALAGGACAPPPATPVSPMARTDTVVVRDTVRIETASDVNADMEDELARLQLQLLEADHVIEEIEGRLDATRQELVRTMAKLQSQASRAEAASGMAEAGIALSTLGRSPGGQDLPEYRQAEGRMTESNEAFDAENFGGALYLAAEARAIVRAGQARLRGSGNAQLRVGETLFALPVPLRTISRSNVRTGPSLDDEILFTLEGGTDVEGQSHTYQWVRVLDEDGREGWIFHTLVTARR